MCKSEMACDLLGSLQVETHVALCRFVHCIAKWGHYINQSYLGLGYKHIQLDPQ